MAAAEMLINNVKNFIKTTPKSKLYLYIFILIAVVGGSVVGLSFMQRENYQPLFSGLAVEDASMIVAKLKEQKVPYKLGLGGTAIYVPKVFYAEGKLSAFILWPGSGRCIHDCGKTQGTEGPL